MSAILSFDLKQCMRILSKDHRWNVLTVLILHTNIRNRCYVSMETVAKMATGGNKNSATRVKKWLESHGAFTLVPVAKRVDDEVKLTPRQHVYQLTGMLRPCADLTCECQKILAPEVAYLHFGSVESIKDDNNEFLPNSINADTFESSPKSITGDNFIVHNGDTGSKDNYLGVLPKEGNTPSAVESPEPPPLTAKPQRPANAWYDAVFAIWGYSAALNGEMAKMLQGASTRKGFREYNLEPGLTPDELRSWAAWYRRTELHNDTHLNMLADRLKIQSSITSWREKRRRIADENERRAIADREFEAAHPEIYGSPLRRSVGVHQ